MPGANNRKGTVNAIQTSEAIKWQFSHLSKFLYILADVLEMAGKELKNLELHCMQEVNKVFWDLHVRR